MKLAEIDCGCGSDDCDGRISLEWDTDTGELKGITPHTDSEGDVVIDALGDFATRAAARDEIQGWYRDGWGLAMHERTTAEQVSEIMGGDGQNFVSPKDHTLDYECLDHGATRDEGGKYGDMTRYAFPDNSTIVICGGGWDLGFVDAPDDCYCWPEAYHGKHNPHCPNHTH